jgi:hypothetical protein
MIDVGVGAGLIGSLACKVIESSEYGKRRWVKRENQHAMTLSLLFVFHYFENNVLRNSSLSANVLGSILKSK